MSAAVAMPRDTVSFRNEMAERSLIGSMLADPDLLDAFGEQIDEEWLTDEVCLIYFRAALKVKRSGAKVAPVTIISQLPDGADDLGRPELARLFIGLTDAAVTRDQFPAMMDVVRDRWARRTIHGVGTIMTKESDRLDSDPYMLAAEIMTRVDRVNVSRSSVDAECIEASAKKLIEALRRKDNRAGATTGLKALDEAINGYKPGQLYVVAARPAMGKSAFAVSSTLRTAMAGHGVAFFSLEMTGEEVSSRALSDLMDHSFAPNYSAIMRGKISDDQIDRMASSYELLNELPLFFDYSPSLNVAEISARARKLKQEWAVEGQSLDVVVVDHLTEISPSQRYSGNPVMEVSENIKALRVLAKELDCCVVALCQLSRDVEKRPDKKPQLSDLRWTGEIEQAAHVVAFLYREHYYLKNDPDADIYRVRESQHEMDFLIRKNRQGETCDIRLWCDMPHSAVRDAR